MSVFDPTLLLRPAIRNLRAFGAACNEFADRGDAQEWVKLDASENPWPPQGAFATQCRANRYPESQPKILKETLAGLYSVAPEQILLCRGSEELPDLLIRSLCQPTKEGVVVCPPTFGMYEVAAALNESPVRYVPLRADKGYDLDVDAILGGWQGHEKLIIIPSPAVPLGHVMAFDQIKAVLDGLAERAIVAIDEAYIEFTEQEGWASYLDRYPHLVVMRTLSKAYALAGARLGALIAAPKLVAKLVNVLPPYPLSAASIEVVRQALDASGIALLTERRALLIKERQYMAQNLKQSVWVEKLFPSDSNFLLVQTRDARAFVEHCRKYGIVVRNRHNDVSQTVRIGMGAPEENDRVLVVLGVSAIRNKA